MRRESPRVRALAGRVKGQVEILLDTDETAAIIEAMGITDLQAKEQYSEPDVRTLAQRIQRIVERDEVPALPLEDDPVDPAPYGYENIFTAAFQRIKESQALAWGNKVGRVHLKGFFFAMPMLVSIIGLLTLRESLWSAIINDVPTATAIGLGTLASFIVTGGYSQAIGRRGLFYRMQEEHTLSRTICYYFIGVGCQVALAAGIVGFCLNVIFSVLPLNLALVALAYYWFLCILWLFMAVLYMLGQPLLFTPIIVIGILVVHVLHHYPITVVIRQPLALVLASLLSFLGGYAAFGRSAIRRVSLVAASISAALVMGIAVRQLAPWVQVLVSGICIVCLLCLSVIVFIFSRKEAQQQAEVQSSTLPRASLLWYKVGSYFAYGTLYYGFLFMDRLLAWTAPDRTFVSGNILFRTSYEVGMDWGLVVLLCTIGVAESAMNSFSERIRDDELTTALEEPQHLESIYRSFYMVRGGVFIALGTLAGVLLWFIVTAIARHSVDPAVRAYLDPITRMVFKLCTPGYAFLSWSLFNNVFLFALSRPERVMPNMWLALIVHTVISYILTRLFGHQYAVIGFLVGSILLAFLTTRSVLQVLKHLDYYYYSAYL